MKRLKNIKKKQEKVSEKRLTPPNFKLSDVWVKKIKKGTVKVKRS